MAEKSKPSSAQAIDEKASLAHHLTHERAAFFISNFQTLGVRELWGLRFPLCGNANITRTRMRYCRNSA